MRSRNPMRHPVLCLARPCASLVNLRMGLSPCYRGQTPSVVRAAIQAGTSAPIGSEEETCCLFALLGRPRHAASSFISRTRDALLSTRQVPDAPLQVAQSATQLSRVQAASNVRLFGTPACPRRPSRADVPPCRAPAWTAQPPRRRRRDVAARLSCSPSALAAMCAVSSVHRRCQAHYGTTTPHAGPRANRGPWRTSVLPAASANDASPTRTSRFALVL